MPNAVFWLGIKSKLIKIYRQIKKMTPFDYGPKPQVLRQIDLWDGNYPTDGDNLGHEHKTSLGKTLQFFMNLDIS